MKSSQPTENKYEKVKATLDDLVGGLYFYKEDAWKRLSESKTNDTLTRDKYRLSSDLWSNLKEIQSELNETNTDASLQAIKFYYAQANTHHEKILNEMLRYYLLGSFFKSMGYYWGNLGKCIDEGSEVVAREILNKQIIIATTAEKKISLEEQYKNATNTLDDLIVGLFTYKENIAIKMAETKILDELSQQKHKLSSELWSQLTALRQKLTHTNIDDTFTAIKLLYNNANKNHEKILQDIICTSCSKYLPTAMSSFLNTYLGSFFSYLGSLWSGNLGKEISKGALQFSEANSKEAESTTTQNNPVKPK